MPKHFTVAFRLVLAMIPWAFCSIQVAQAQVTSDGTLSTGVSNTGSDYTITGGTTSGTNLFHSFDQFSVPTGGSATFNNSTAIANIFSRVMGGSLSNIDGLIAAQGTANVFLLNPAGIRFGENARLNIGGSFFASTAEKILFPNSLEFDAMSPIPPALLSISSPVGLNMGTNPGAIRVEGPGHGFVAVPFLFRGARNIGLEVNSGQALSLVGGAVTLDGGILTAEQGRVEIGAVASGQVGWVAGRLSYDNVTAFQDVTFANQATADASESSGGVQIVGRNVTFTNGSVAVLQTTGNAAGGVLQVQSSERLAIIGTNEDGTIASGMRSETLAAGDGAQIEVETGQLFVLEGGRLLSVTTAEGDGGDIQVDAIGWVEFRGISVELAEAFISSIDTVSVGSGDVGNVRLSAQNLVLADSAALLARNFGTGRGGDVLVDVAESVAVIGLAPVRDTFLLTNISSVAFRSGNSGNVQIDTARLSVREGAIITTNALASGDAGSLTINAAESIELVGKDADFNQSPRVESAITIENEAFRSRFGLPDVPTGDSGNVLLNTPQLTVADGANIGTQNQGTGLAGSLQVNADTIMLRDAGSIVAATVSGEGGNINLNANQYILLRRGSLISAEAGGTGNGGNITINAPFIVAVPSENSDIIANAFQGNGGNITITATGILGLEFRDQLTQFSDITASSQFGVSGTVTITNPNTTLTGLDAELQGDVLDPNQEVAQGCDAVGNSRFVATGRGGVPENPLNPRPGNSTWNDMRDLSAFRQISPTPIRQSQTLEPPVIIEATGVRRNANGELELYAETAVSTPRIASTACTSTFRDN
ncbi:MAG: S-layer family protein [Cyanobacteria bacterium P01_G01_bin.54]